MTHPQDAKYCMNCTTVGRATMRSNLYYRGENYERRLVKICPTCDTPSPQLTISAMGGL